MKKATNIISALILLITMLAVTPTQSVYAAGIVINTNADDTTAGNTFCTLREAITNANADTDTTSGDCTAGSGNDTITFAGNYTITLSSSLPDITDADDVTITGNGTSNTIIQAAASAGIATYRIIKVNGSGVGATFEYMTFRYGVEASGGAINNSSGAVILNHMVVSDNQVNNSVSTGLNGGAISTNSGTVTINNSAIINNSVTTSDTSTNVRGSGGAIFVGGGTVTLNNTTVSGNSAIRGGGGLFSNGGTININYSTITNNTSNNADGVAYTSLDGGGINRNAGAMNLKNSIVAGNKKGLSSPTDDDCSGTITSLDYNLTGSGTGCSLAGTGDVTVTPSTVFTSVLGALSDNGGQTHTHALIVGGAAVDVIPSGTNGCGTAPFDEDQRGGTRPYNNNCDIGAYELKTIQSVSTTGVDSGDCTITDCASIAYAYSKAQAGNIINVAAGTYTETSEYDITKSITINGAGATSTIVQAAASAGIATHRFYKIIGSTVTANIQNLTLRYGVQASGGALNVASGTLNLTNVTLSDNQVNNSVSTGLNGGAISINGGTVNINNSAIINNSVTTSDTSSNIRGSGGGIFVGSGTLTLNNVTISGNSSIRGGGGLFANGGTLNINYSTIANNTSDNADVTALTSVNGGGINRNAGTLNLKSSIVAGNKKGLSSPGDNDCSGTITSQGYNLTGSSSGCSLAGTGDSTITPSNVFTTVLNALADNGGSTYTHELMLASPASNVIPSGTNTCGTAPFDKDQRGMPRPLFGFCDIGAFEYQDASLPTVNSFAAATPTNNLSIPITAFTASDNTGVIGYLITETSTPPAANAAGWTASVPTTYTVSSTGSYTLYPWAKDTQGNVSALYSSPANVTVETTAPTVLSFARQSPSGSPTNANTLIFRVTFSEDVSGVGLADFALSGTTAGLDDFSTVNASVYDIEVNGTDSVNDGDLVSYNGVVGLNFSGSMSITDLAGTPLDNIEPATDETYTLDNSAPVITINNPDTSKTITASASDGTLTMSITIGSTCDGTLTFIAYSDQTFSTEADNGKRVCYKAVDAVGNTTYSLSDAIAGIDTTITAPVVSSITRASTNPTSASSVDFTVTFSKSVTGVDVNDFILTTSGLTGASVSAVSGSGASYIVTAATGYKPGTLRLDIPNTATITDLSSNSLAGLPFTAGESYTVNKSPTFSDVPFDYWSWPYIESILNAGITGGCSSNPLSFCPTQSVTRAQMAVFILKGIHGQSFTPPSINSNTGFDDVASDYWAAAWIKQLAAEGITGGCGNGNYCPENTVTRDQMAVFLLKAKYGSSYTPPAVNGNTGFSDVPADYWAAAWIKQLAAEAITGGCGGGNYCPSNPVTRDQMAVFLQKTFGLPLP